jgi:hypothetical protein
MRRASILGAAAALCLLVGAAGCGGTKNPSEGETVEDLSGVLQDGGVEKDDADCLAEKVVDEVGADEVNKVDLTGDEPSAELQEQIAAAAVECGSAVSEG